MEDTAEVVLLCLNVHSWTDREGQRNINRVAKVIEDAKADIVGLCEVTVSPEYTYPEPRAAAAGIDRKSVA